MNEQIQAALQARINQFATDVTELLKSAVAAAVDQSLRGSVGRGGRGGAGGKRGPGRPSKVKVDLDAIVKAVGKSAEGMRMEELIKVIGGQSKTLRPAMHKLIKEKKLTTKGKARGVRYFVK